MDDPARQDCTAEELPPALSPRERPRRAGPPCFPRCDCGQDEDPFPSLREAIRVLESYGWRRAPPAEAWSDADGWRPGYGRRWYCPPCRARWDSARRRAQEGFRRRYTAT